MPGDVRTAFDKALTACNVDTDKAGGVIEAARRLADMMDTPGWPMVGDRYDNVSPSTFLKYCDALGMTGDAIAKADTKSSLAALRVTVNRRAANG